MARPGTGEAILTAVLSVMLGFVAFALSGSIFVLIFVAVVVAVLFDYNTKLNDLKDRLTELESKMEKDQVAGLDSP